VRRLALALAETGEQGLDPREALRVVRKGTYWAPKVPLSAVNAPEAAIARSL
jgi:hypothetical protein